MDILLSALESGTDTLDGSTTDHDDPGFVELVGRVTRRIVGLGTVVPSDEVSAAVLSIIQDVAQFTLSWAEPENSVIQAPTDITRITPQYDESIRAERRW